MRLYGTGRDLSRQTPIILDCQFLKQFVDSIQCVEGRNMRFQLLIGLVLLSTPSLPPALIAQDFRIETEVFRGEENELISENLTLFAGDLILDFMLPADRTRFPEEIVIFQSRQKKFVLLNTRRKIRTEIFEGEILQMLAALQNSTIVDDKNRFLFHPVFEERFDRSSGILTLESEQLTYRVKGSRPKDDNTLHKYYEFIGQFARLNATDPRRMPPFARLKLNSALKKHGFIPDEVQLKLIPSLDAPSDTIELRTTHNVMSRLSEKDEKRIQSAKRYWMDFDPVSLAQFRNLQQTAKASGKTEDR